MYVDKMRQRHNDYLDDYFESLDKERADKEGEMARFVEDTNASEFGQEFGALAEILGLTRSDGEEIRKCYITYLEVFISYYKTARAPEYTTKVNEDSESLEPYQWNIGKTCTPIAVEKGKEKLEPFGIKLEEEEDCKNQQSTHYAKEKLEPFGRLHVVLADANPGITAKSLKRKKAEFEAKVKKIYEATNDEIK
nr:ARID DNA-binding domain-containing protein [Tanacetum cinerariifolium]